MTAHERLSDSPIEVADFEPKKKEKDSKNIETSFNASAIVRKNITKLKYMGPSTAERLLHHGFDTIEKIARSMVAKVSEVEEIGEKSTQKIIKAPRAFNNLKMLNEYSTAERSDLPKYEYEELAEEYDTIEEDLESLY